MRYKRRQDPKQTNNIRLQNIIEHEVVEAPMVLLDLWLKSHERTI